MKSKTLRIFIIVIVFISIVPICRILSIYNSDSSSPKSYSTIDDFEKETGVKVYEFYDIVEFFDYGKKTPLKVSSTPLNMGLLSNKKEEKSYSIEIFKDRYYHLTMSNNPFKEVTSHMKMTVMENGILYQYHDYEESYNSRFFTGIFVKDDFYYRVTFTDNDLEVSQAEQKMIDYIKLVENIQ